MFENITSITNIHRSISVEDAAIIEAVEARIFDNAASHTFPEIHEDDRDIIFAKASRNYRWNFSI